MTGSLPWDGVPGPHFADNGKSVKYVEFNHADYTLNALENKFSLTLTGKIDIKEYESRVLSMARVYQVLKSTTTEQKASWSVASFNTISKDNAELKSAESQSGSELESPIYRFELYKHGTKSTEPNDVRKIRLQSWNTEVAGLHSQKPTQHVKKNRKRVMGG